MFVRVCFGWCLKMCVFFGIWDSRIGSINEHVTCYYRCVTLFGVHRDHDGLSVLANFGAFADHVVRFGVLIGARYKGFYSRYRECTEATQSMICGVCFGFV